MVPFVILYWDVNRDFHLREMSSQEGEYYQAEYSPEYSHSFTFR
jgi:hypothetical protein